MNEVEWGLLNDRMSRQAGIVQGTGGFFVRMLCMSFLPVPCYLWDTYSRHSLSFSRKQLSYKEVSRDEGRSDMLRDMQLCDPRFAPMPAHAMDSHRVVGTRVGHTLEEEAMNNLSTVSLPYVVLHSVSRRRFDNTTAELWIRHGRSITVRAEKVLHRWLAPGNETCMLRPSYVLLDGYRLCNLQVHDTRVRKLCNACRSHIPCNEWIINSKRRGFLGQPENVRNTRRRSTFDVWMCRLHDFSLCSKW